MRRKTELLKFLLKNLVDSENVLNFAATIGLAIMSKKEKEKRAKEFWKYYKATQGSITITDPKVLD